MKPLNLTDIVVLYRCGVSYCCIVHVVANMSGCLNQPELGE